MTNLSSENHETALSEAAILDWLREDDPARLEDLWALADSEIGRASCRERVYCEV